MNLNFIKISFLSLLSVFTLVACSTDDDINDIFIGKTWYMSGGKLNGTDFTKDQVSSLYVNKDSYWIIFSQGTFTGKLSTNTSFSGNWEADGGHRRLKMNVTSSVNCEESVLDETSSESSRMSPGIRAIPISLRFSATTTATSTWVQ